MNIHKEADGNVLFTEWVMGQDLNCHGWYSLRNYSEGYVHQLNKRVGVRVCQIENLILFAWTLALLLSCLNSWVHASTLFTLHACVDLPLTRAWQNSGLMLLLFSCYSSAHSSLMKSPDIMFPTGITGRVCKNLFTFCLILNEYYPVLYHSFSLYLACISHLLGHITLLTTTACFEKLDTNWNILLLTCPYLFVHFEAEKSLV